jgi:hypothetical protein
MPGGGIKLKVTNESIYYEMKNNQVGTSNILINFDFEEVNAAVLRNAQIWKFKKNALDKRLFSVFSPNEFAHLYFHADKIYTFKNEQHPEYKQILEYKLGAKPSLSSKVKSRIYTLALDLIQNNLIRKYIYSKFYFTGRQLKFLVKSGLEKSILKKIKNICNFQYVRVGDYMDCSTFTVVENNLTKWFSLTFSYLAEMITNGDVYIVTKNQSGLKMIEYSNLSTYFSSAKPKLVLRTRNFQTKATIHNSKIELLTPLVEKLLENGFFVLNIGTPAMSLDIHNNDYAEVSHNMLIEEEFFVCGSAAACIMTAEAGLFTAFAATDLPLVQYDEEWSATFVGVSLFAARRKAGFQDLDIRTEIASGNFEEAARLIANFSSATNFARDPELYFRPIIVDLDKV